VRDAKAHSAVKLWVTLQGAQIYTQLKLESTGGIEMKSKKKVFVTVLCAAALVVASVLGTMAYLTSKTDTVSNTFTVGKVGITLDEAKVESDGTPVDNAERVTANQYKLIPGHKYTKDPTVHVDEDSEGSWLFVKVENSISNLEAKGDTIADQMTENGWTLVSGETNVYAYKEIVNASKDILVFGSFTLAGDAVLNTVTDSDAINITAYAVQADGFGTAVEAWTAAKTNW